ncbi:multidrug effflux MFS transporter [Brevibacillus laterosporus]|uniref:multidrug effflux MFS transporter n=1 Tax=Brevibacillus laterosporus TaxID=1465 RepID=UPI003D1F9EF4
MTKKISTPSLLLFIILVGFPQISETIYTPSLPDISQALGVSSNIIQLTLSLYFFGFALGVFFWGRLSDVIGRRPALLWGIFIYGAGSLGCYLSNAVEWLLVSRFVQAFGASTGSVVTQAILRESIDGGRRHAVFAQISAALAFTPAIGPLLGGFIDQALGFRAVFFTLVVMGVLVFVYTWRALPETKLSVTSKSSVSLVAKRMARDQRVWLFGLLIGITNGILFSYYAEAPFIYMEFFHMTPGVFGFFGVFVALASIIGALLSKKLLQKLSAERIIYVGSLVTALGAGSLTALVLIGLDSSILSLVLLVSCIFILLMGIGMAIPNCLSLALVHYHDTQGTAGAIFGLSYYFLVSFITTGMSYLHNGMLLPMPMYFLLLALVMIVVSYKLMIPPNTMK